MTHSASAPNAAPLVPLVTGSRGQLGRALLRICPDAVAANREALDFSQDADAVRRAFGAELDRNPAVSGVINAAAYTAVDKAEEEEPLALRVNAEAPGAISEECARRGLPLVHISTDYVFDGAADRPYAPDDATAPLNAYGRTKLAGERAVAAACSASGAAPGAAHAVLRTSWVYDGTGKNFLTTMLRLAQTRDALTVVDDQKGRPTYAGHLAEAALAALSGLQRDPALSGTYHVSGTGEVISWAQFARAIFERAGAAMSVSPIPSSDYPTPARRPLWSVMDVAPFESAFRHALPDWRSGLEAAMAEREAAAMAAPATASA